MNIHVYLVIFSSQFVYLQYGQELGRHEINHNSSNTLSIVHTTFFLTKIDIHLVNVLCIMKYIVKHKVDNVINK